MSLERLKFRTGWMMALILAILALSAASFGQSLIAGDIQGTVTDPSNAVVANATVTAKSVDTGIAQTSKTNNSGLYRFTLLKPGPYVVTVNQPGFAAAQQQVAVAVGQTTTSNFQLSVSQTTQTVEVSGAVEPVITDTASINTSYTQQEMRELPNPGGDITNIAQSTPGAVVNNTGGYGNFTVNGLPATSNLFTVNGENDMDPYFNINNSGATNLTLGSNEVAEATVIANPYGGEYGQLAGAQVTYVTRSGTNQFHGNAQWWWNGRTMNANDWMNNNSGTPRPFSNANQWATGVGGPIIKDHTFFFADFEGLRFVLPNVKSTTIPSPAFASAVQANVAALEPNEAALYSKLFSLYSSAPGASSAVAIPNSSACNALTLPGFDPTTEACAYRFQAEPTALASEYVFGVRVDQKVTNSDNMFFRYKLDHGTQPTLLDSINSAFDAISHQPSWDTQVNETHVFGPRSTNAFTAALSHYVAQFQQDEASALSTFPYAIITSGSVPFSSFGYQYDFPQGRNITQYQFIDDFTLNRGQHNFKFGANFRRYDVSDHNFFFNNPGVYFGYVGTGLQEFANGLAYQYRQTDNLSSDVPIAMWGLGFYGQDEWNIKSNLKLTLALRAERNSNPVCQTNCFANFVSEWSSLPSTAAGHAGAPNVPYNQDIATGLHQAYPGIDSIDLAPRFGFSWSPFNDQKTIISGGFGIFYDSPPAGLVDDLLSNPPVAVSLRVRPAGGTPAFDQTATGSGAIYQQSAAAFNSGFASGQTYAQISASLAALGVPFAQPAFTSIVGTVHAPRWQEWNLQIQQQLNNATALVINYVGNHGIRIPYTNAWYNAYDTGPDYGFANGVYNGAVPIGMVAADAPNPNYGTITQVQSGAISNYNGLTVSLRRQFSHMFSAHLNYTWGHNLDEVSNGGIFTYGDSYLGQLCPSSLRACNYGNSDYDIRQNINADYVFNPGFHFENKFVNEALGGWQWSGKVFWRTGLPLSVYDANWNGVVSNGGNTAFAQPIGSGTAGQLGCGESAASASGSASGSCLDPSAFVDSGSGSFNGYAGYPTERRNQYRGPRFFDMDMSLYKTFKFGEHLNFGLGAQAFNVFNHPNFYTPDNGLGDSTFGQISSMTSVPTSPYGNFLGFDSSPRVVQLSAKLVF